MLCASTPLRRIRVRLLASLRASERLTRSLMIGFGALIAARARESERPFRRQVAPDSEGRFQACPKSKRFAQAKSVDAKSEKAKLNVFAMKKRRKPKPKPKAPTAPQDKLTPLRRKAAVSGLLYEGNPKHRDPWQSGRRGTLCPRGISVEQAQELLLDSIVHGGQRYAIKDGQLFAAKQHATGLWHAHPVGWSEAPQNVYAHFKNSELVSKRDLRRLWKQ